MGYKAFFNGILAILNIVISGLILPDFCRAQESIWSVSASNWMQYWHHYSFVKPHLPEGSEDVEAKEDSVDNRFIVNFDLGDFYAGAWLRVFEPARPDTSYERITQRYFGWSENGLTLHLGNLYQTFDHGLTLNAFLDDAVYFDNNLDGVKISGMYDHFEFDALSARGLNIRTNQREYTIRGARGAVKPLQGIKAGFSFVRFKQNDFLDFSHAANANLTAFNVGINRGPIELYSEYAYKRGIDPFGMRADGDVTYLSGSLSQKIFSLYAEYKNLINMLYPGPAGAFNTPPPVSHSGRTLVSLANAFGERAYQLGALIAPSFTLNFDLAFSESRSRGGPIHLYLANKYGGTRWAPTSRLTMNFHWERFDYTIEDEIENYLDSYFYLGPSQTVSIVAYTRRFVPSDSGSTSYHENYLTLGYGRGSLLEINAGTSYSNNKITFDPRIIYFGEVTVRFKSHELVVFVGGERGGLICSSGVCSFRPTFQGTRVMLFSRF
jgi:hypothetical protein